MPINPDTFINDYLNILDPSKRHLPAVEGARGFSQAEVRGVNESNRTVQAIVSTPNPDRYEEIVTPEAFRKWLPTFMKNPVLVAGHTYIGGSGEPTVIGHWLDLRITPQGLIGTCQFMTDDSLAESWWQRFRQKAVRAFSVGWITHASEMRDVALPDNTTKRLRVFTEVELIEVSAVTIPANRESLVRAATALAHRHNDDEPNDNGIAIGTRGELTLTNRQVSIVTRALMPVMRDLLKAEIGKRLNTDPGGHLQNLIEEVIVMMRASDHADHGDRAFGPDCYGEDDDGLDGLDDLDLDGDDDDNDNVRDLDVGAILKDILRPTTNASGRMIRTR